MSKAHLKKYLRLNEVQLEEQILQDWMAWCSHYSYSMTNSQLSADGKLLLLSPNIKDYQNLLADAALFNFWQGMWQHFADMVVIELVAWAKEPTKEEAKTIYNGLRQETYAFYSKKLMREARTKKIDIPCQKMN